MMQALIVFIAALMTLDNWLTGLSAWISSRFVSENKPLPPSSQPGKHVAWYPQRESLVWMTLYSALCWSLSVLNGSESHNLLLTAVAAVLSACCLYVVRTLLQVRPKLAAGLVGLGIRYIIQFAIIYGILLLFGQTGTPRWMMDQLQLFLFAHDLVVERSVVLPSLLLLLIVMTSVTSEAIGKFLSKYNNPIHPVSASMSETAAAVETPLPQSERLIHVQKSALMQGVPADMTVEELIEVTRDPVPGSDSKTKESVKVQYLWYNKEEEASKGRYIGILERLLICLFVYYEVYQGLMLVGAMKTLARFKLFENKAFAEYYLIGTLISMLVAVGCGFLLHRLLHAV